MDALVADERARGLRQPGSYAEFAARVVLSRDRLRSMLLDLRRGGGRLAAYGAAAKGNTLLNYCTIGTELIDFVADTTPLKQGLVTPGMHIPVREDSWLIEAQPDYTLLLAWNYADAIIRRHADYLRRGGRFIHPIPLARVL